MTAPSDILTNGTWVERILRLREAGVTREQAEVMFDIFDDARAFHSETLSARVRATADAMMVDDRRGRSHDIEPEADALSYIDFEEAPAGLVERFWFMVSAAIDALRVEVDQTGSDIAERLNIEGEEALWRWVEDRLNAAGFDTYNSDTRFEVFPGGTPEPSEYEPTILGGRG